MDLRNKRVHFRIRDVYIPEPEKLVMALHGDDLLQGTVLDVSREGQSMNVYAVVKLEGVAQQIVIAVEDILGDEWTPFR